MPESLSNNSIQLTPSAVNRICKVMNNDSDLGDKFRVNDTRGGCSGFQYGDKFD